MRRMSAGSRGMCPMRDLGLSANTVRMRNLTESPMIRHSRGVLAAWQPRTALISLLTLTVIVLLTLPGPALAGDGEADLPPDPDWCNCPAIERAADEAVRSDLIAETERKQAQCREDLGVSLTQERKGQGARLDACRCRCLEAGAVPVDKPAGDRNKPARQGP